MRVTVRLFAGLRERAGTGRRDVDLSDEARVGDVWPALELGDEPAGLVFAVNRAYVVPILKLVQERMDLRQELEAMGTKVEMGSLEDDFVKVARTYSDRRGISYAAWREIGVDAAVLKRAGLTRAM